MKLMTIRSKLTNVIKFKMKAIKYVFFNLFELCFSNVFFRFKLSAKSFVPHPSFKQKKLKNSIKNYRSLKICFFDDNTEIKTIDSSGKILTNHQCIVVTRRNCIEIWIYLKNSRVPSGIQM